MARWKKEPEPAKEAASIKHESIVPVDLGMCDRCGVARARVLLESRDSKHTLALCLHHFHVNEVSVILAGFKLVVDNRNLQ